MPGGHKKGVPLTEDWKRNIARGRKKYLKSLAIKRCSAADCIAPVLAKGLCRHHYDVRYWRAKGQTRKAMTRVELDIRRSLAAAFRRLAAEITAR
jgi:hypothetical protein